MNKLKFKVGDRVRIKSIDWYNENKTTHGDIWFDNAVFVGGQSLYCGCELTICLVTDDSYHVIENDYYWTDEMIEGLVEEDTKPKFKVGDKITNGEITFTILTLSSDRYGAEDTFGECGSVCFKSQDEWKIVEEETKPKYEDEVTGEYYSTPKYLVRPNGYQFVDENGNVINATKIVLEKKKGYPKTYAECLSVLGIYNGLPDVEIYNAKPSECKLFESLIRLKRCRDAYWKIAGDEMGLGKPWEPDWSDASCSKYIIDCFGGEICKGITAKQNTIFAFSTEEMRDAFYENFKKEIEICKELL